MVTAVALRGISKKMKVAAAQRVVVSLRAQQCSLVGDHLDGSFCSSMAAAGTHLPAHGPRLTLKSGSVEAARFLPKARLKAEATPHVTALGEGALLYVKCFSEEFSCRADRLAPIEHPSSLCPRTHIGLCHTAANELARQSRGAGGAGRSRRVRRCS